MKAGAAVIAPNGRPFTEQSIGMTLAVRNLMHDLRSAGEVTRGPPPFSPRDRSAFLSALDRGDPARAARATARVRRPVAPPLVQLKDIALTFGGTPLLAGVELSVSAGERVCLVGRNGSGKSTLLKIAAGLVEPDRGTRFLQPGATVRYLPQEPDFAGAATTLAYVEAGLGPGDDPPPGALSAGAAGARRRARTPPASPAARRGARRSRACSRPRPTSCCSTSPPIISISPPSNGSSANSPGAAPRWS